jgi:hypothetical protein
MRRRPMGEQYGPAVRTRRRGQLTRLLKMIGKALRDAGYSVSAQGPNLAVGDSITVEPNGNLGIVAYEDDSDGFHLKMDSENEEGYADAHFAMRVAAVLAALIENP